MAFSVYPNPFNANLIIDYEQSEWRKETPQVIIYDILGLKKEIMKKVLYISLVLILVSSCKIQETKLNKEVIQPTKEVEKISKEEFDKIRKKQLEDFEKSELKRLGYASIFDLVVKDIKKEIPEFYGFELQLGSIIENESNKKDRLGVSFIRKEDKGFIILDQSYNTGILEFLENARGSGTTQVYSPDHQIVDTIQVNNLREYTFVIARDCLEQGEKDTRIVAMIEGDSNYYKKESYSEIKRAWKINFQTKKLEEQNPVNEITCINDWYKRMDWYKRND